MPSTATNDTASPKPPPWWRRDLPIGVWLLMALIVAAALAIASAAHSYAVHERDEALRAKVSKTYRVLSNLKQQLLTFETARDHFPTTSEGFGPLVDKGLLEALPIDGWHHELIYTSPGIRNPQSFDLHSLGPDGIDGTTDDIWSK